MADIAHEILLKYGNELLALQAQTTESSVQARNRIRAQLAIRAVIYAELVAAVAPESPIT
jgi:hypothetical protein